MRTFVRSCLVLALCVQLCHATEAFPREAEALPNLELLEFLGEWETEDGELIDPLSLNRAPGSVPSTGESRGRADGPGSASTREEDVTQPRSGQPDNDDTPSIND